MFRATNRVVHVVKLEIQAFDPQADAFNLAITLDTYPRFGDCPEAAAVAQAQLSGKKATLALKDVGGRWVYELSDQSSAVNLVGSPTKASAKINGEEVEELKWTFEAEGVPAPRLLTLCRWHGSAVDLCAETAPDEATNNEPPLFDMIRRGEASVTASLASQPSERADDMGSQPPQPDGERMIPLSVAKKAVEKAVKFALDRQAEQDEDDDLTLTEDGKIRVTPATVVEAAAQAREDEAANLRAKYGDDGRVLAEALEVEAARIREEGQARFGPSKFVRGWDKEV